MIDSRQKGKRGELEFRDIVNKVFGYTKEEGVRRTPNSGGLSIKGDLIQLRGALQKYHFEIKNEAKPRLWAYIKQAEGDCSYDKTPIVGIKLPQSNKFYCVIEASALLSLIKKVDETSAIVLVEETNKEDTK